MSNSLQLTRAQLAAALGDDHDTIVQFEELITEGSTNSTTIDLLIQLFQRLPPGNDGSQGQDGDPGVPGRDGARGRDGAQGFPIPGQDGQDGESGFLIGSGGSGTVTSVAFAATPTGIFDVSGSPITTSGTITLSMDNQNANIVLAGPSTGAATTPAFRALVAADLPNTAVTPGSYSNASITVDQQGRLTSASAGTSLSIGGGTSFPGSPANNDLFYRTDLDLLCFYDSTATAWLTVQQYIFPFTAYTALTSAKTVTTNSLLGGNPAFSPNYGFYMTEFRVPAYVSTTNTGSSYWRFDLQKHVPPNTKTVIATVNSSAESPDNVIMLTTSSFTGGNSLGTNVEFMTVDAVKVSSPGNLEVAGNALLVGRLIIT